MKRESLIAPGEYIAVPNWLARIPTAVLAPSAKLIYACLLNHLGENDESWPCQARISEETGLNANRVNGDLKILERLGLVTGRRTQGNKHYRLSRVSDLMAPRFTEAMKSRFPGLLRSRSPETVESGYPDAVKVTTPENHTKEPHQGTTTHGGPAAPDASPSSVNSASSEREKESNQSSTSSPQESGPAARKMPRARKDKPRGLTDLDLLAVRQNPTTISAYYLFGLEAVGKPPAEWAKLGLAPAPTNWSPITGDYGRPEAGVGLAALAAYAWYRLSCARFNAGVPLGLPAFGRLLGVVKALRSRMTEGEVVEHIDRITANWPAIQAALGNWGASLTLDEGTLGIPQILAQGERLKVGGNHANRGMLADHGYGQRATTDNLDLAARVGPRL